MTSILKVDKLQDASGTGTPYIKDAVLNVLQATADTKGSAIASGNNSDVISQAITPQSTNSKILVRCVIHIGGDSNSYGYGRLFKDSTAIGVATSASGSQINASFQVMTKNWTYQGYRTSPHAFEFLDAPIKRVASKDYPVPYADELEKEILVQTSWIEKAIEEILEY